MDTQEPATIQAPRAGVVVGPKRPTSGSCRNHPNDPATWRCQKCGDILCEDCVEMTTVNSVELAKCPCSGLARALGSSGVITHGDFATEVTEAFAYPFAGQGFMILLSGTVVLGGIMMLTSGNIFFILSLVLAIFVCGYITDYMFDIITSTAAGSSEPPEWPEFTDIFGSGIIPFLKGATLAFLAFAPAVFCFFQFGFINPIPWVLLLAGILYHPMAFAQVAMDGRLSGANPVRAYSNICRIPGKYALCCGMMALVVGASWIAGFLTGLIPWVGGFVGTFASFYFLLVEMRVLGLTYAVSGD